ncbi:MAG: hypothetical protein Ct9H300mP25_05090 [Acidobacteriota bacterium]|nr:MAG: hypothetical protein Ct9H300mP25_05090 [Acidobacteriota bacterium]
MFSASLELILNVAYREAASRRHTHLTIEHLLYALAHDPEGERILAACGADLPFYVGHLMNSLAHSRRSQGASSPKNQLKLSASGEYCKLLFSTFRVLARMKFALEMYSQQYCNNQKPMPPK